MRPKVTQTTPIGSGGKGLLPLWAHVLAAVLWAAGMIVFALFHNPAC